MSNRLDQAGDAGNTELVKYAQLYPLPDFVKVATVKQLSVPPSHSVNFYADAREPYQFPCHSPAATIVSALFYENKKAEINPNVREFIEDRLQKFAAHWAVSGYVTQIRKKHAELHKESDLPDSVFALVQVAGGQKYRQFPLRNAVEIKAAAEWYHQNLPQLRHEFPYTDRSTIATKILKKAEDFGAALSEQARETLEKCAGQGVNEPVKIAAAIRHRLICGERVAPGTRLMFEKLAENVAARPKAFIDPSTTRELAQTLDGFDRSHGLLNKYSSVVPPPEDVVYGVTFSKAAAAKKQACATLTGAVYNKADFAKLSWEELANAFGNDIARDLCDGFRTNPEKVAEFVATLPLGDARMFDDLMLELNIQPLRKNAGYGLTPEVYDAMMAATAKD